jgi:hypothetical protein
MDAVSPRTSGPVDGHASLHNASTGSPWQALMVSNAIDECCPAVRQARLSPSVTFMLIQRSPESSDKPPRLVADDSQRSLDKRRSRETWRAQTLCHCQSRFRIGLIRRTTITQAGETMRTTAFGAMMCCVHKLEAVRAIPKVTWTSRPSISLCNARVIWRRETLSQAAAWFHVQGHCTGGGKLERRRERMSTPRARVCTRPSLESRVAVAPSRPPAQQK